MKLRVSDLQMNAWTWRVYDTVLQSFIDADIYFS